MKTFYVYDEKKYPRYCEITWHLALLREAQRRGFIAKRIKKASQLTEPGYLFVRLPMRQPELNAQRAEVRSMSTWPQIRMIQDMQQIDLYEDKLAQTAAFARWMPKTRVLVTQDSAHDALEFVTYPFISKSSVGASSQNVRLIDSYETACQEIRLAFTTRGIPTSRGFKDQRGYLIWQEFIPHDVTYRVNIIGRQFAVFKRFCYGNRPMAQTGNVEPVMEMDEEMASLLAYATLVSHYIGTKWCALDILKSSSGWKLLETSIGWPWPSPGECNKGTFFFSEYQWIDMFKVLFDEIEVGVWG